MPWTAKESHSHSHKANTPSKKKKWAKIASGYLRSHPGEEASAIKIANAAMHHDFWLEDDFQNDAWSEHVSRKSKRDKRRSQRDRKRKKYYDPEGREEGYSIEEEDSDGEYGAREATKAKEEPKFGKKEKSESKSGTRKRKKDPNDPGAMLGHDPDIVPEESLSDTATTDGDVIKCDVPLFIRILEYAREDTPKGEAGDLALHKLTERAIDLANKGYLTMEHYEKLVKDGLIPDGWDPDQPRVPAGGPGGGQWGSGGSRAEMESKEIAALRASRKPAQAETEHPKNLIEEINAAQDRGDTKTYNTLLEQYKALPHNEQLELYKALSPNERYRALNPGSGRPAEPDRSDQPTKPPFAERAEKFLSKLDPYLRTHPPEPVPESGRKKSPEEARVAALTAGRDRISYKSNPKESWYQRTFITPGGIVGNRAQNLPYKISKYDPDTGIHHIIGSEWSFANAYQHPDEGTHVIQTHGSEAEFEQQVRGVASNPPTSQRGSQGTAMAKGAALGLLVAGPAGAAVGALMGSGGGPQAKWVELPRPIITEKRLAKDSNMTMSIEEMIKNMNASAEVQDDLGKTICTECGGRGMIHGKTCAACDGAGWVNRTELASYGGGSGPKDSDYREPFEDASYDREFTTEQRKKASESGAAMKGGGFPINNKKDLSNAKQALGRASNRAATIRHIKKRARALGVALPEGWPNKKDSVEVADTVYSSRVVILSDVELADHQATITAQSVHMTDSMVLELDDAAQMQLTRDGYLKAMPRIARTGIQVYTGKECGIDFQDLVKVYRPEKEVFATDACHSYTHLPVTLDHPKETVNATNWKKYAIGETADEVLRDGNTVRVPLMLRDFDAIKKVQDGVNQLSVGYDCDLEWNPGVTADGEEYDAVQRCIRANHLAVVSSARGGSKLKLVE